MKPFKIVNLEKETLFLRLLQNEKLGAVTKDGSYRVLKYSDGSMIDGFKLGKVFFEDRFQSSIISPMYGYATCADKTDNSLIVIDFDAKKALYKCVIPLERITAAAIDKNEHYLSTGGNDGKVFLWDLKSGEFMQKGAPHPEYISLISFSPNGFYLISCDYGGFIVISNLASDIKTSRLELLEKQKISALHFIDETRVVFGGEKGDLVYFDISKPKNIKIVKHSVHGIAAIQPSIKREHLFVLTRDSRVSIVDSKTLKPVVQSLFSQEEEIRHIVSSENSDLLLVGDAKGKLYFYQLHDEGELKKAIDDENYELAYKIVDENTLLMGGEQHLRLEEIWHDRFDDAFRFMTLKEYETANGVLAPFKNVKEKRVVMQKLNSEFKMYDKLDELIRAGSLNPAYSLVANSEYLKKTPIFLDLEQKWESAFREAKELVLRQNNIQAAKTILKDFYTVQSKSALITALLRSKELFIEMKNLIKMKDFKGFFTLVMKYKFLKDTGEYKLVMDYGDNLLRSIKERIKAKRYREILSDIQKLNEFKHLEGEVKEIHEFAKIANEFLLHYGSKEYLECYKMVDANPSLVGFDEAKTLEERWQQIIYQASLSASKGDIAATKEILGRYIHLESRHGKIGSIFRLCFYTQLRNISKIAPVDTQKIERGVLKYIMMFGYDDDMEYLLGYLKKEHGADLMISQSYKERKAGNWYDVTKGNIPDDIFS